MTFFFAFQFLKDYQRICTYKLTGSDDISIVRQRLLSEIPANIHVHLYSVCGVRWESEVRRGGGMCRWEVEVWESEVGGWCLHFLQWGHL